MCHALLAGAMAFGLGSCGGGGGGNNSADKGSAPNEFLPKEYASCKVDITVPNGTKNSIELSFTCENTNNGTQGTINNASAKNIPNFAPITSASGTWSQNAPTSYNRLNGINFHCERIAVTDMAMDIDNRTPITGTMQELVGRAVGGGLIVHRVGGDAASGGDEYIPLLNSNVTITYTPRDNKPSGGTTSGDTAPGGTTPGGIDPNE